MEAATPGETVPSPWPSGTPENPQLPCAVHLVGQCCCYKENSHNTPAYQDRKPESGYTWNFRLNAASESRDQQIAGIEMLSRWSIPNAQCLISGSSRICIMSVTSRTRAPSCFQAVRTRHRLLRPVQYKADQCLCCFPWFFNLRSVSAFIEEHQRGIGCVCLSLLRMRTGYHRVLSSM